MADKLKVWQHRWKKDWQPGAVIPMPFTKEEAKQLKEAADMIDRKQKPIDANE